MCDRVTALSGIYYSGQSVKQGKYLPFITVVLQVTVNPPNFTDIGNNFKCPYAGDRIGSAIYAHRSARVT